MRLDGLDTRMKLIYAWEGIEILEARMEFVAIKLEGEGI